MVAARLFSILVDLGVKLWITIDNKLSWEAPKGVVTKVLREDITTYKNDLLSIIRNSQKKYLDQHIDRIIHDDCLHALRQMPADSVDLVCTDPPYGLGFMNKKWDKELPSVEIWRELLRVLKPGGFAFVMSGPRQDKLMQMISLLQQAGFAIGFTSMYWTYASGFTKAHDISKAIDKQAGVAREIVGVKKGKIDFSICRRGDRSFYQNAWGSKEYTDLPVTVPATPEAKKFAGAVGGFQPKPAVEVALVAMKPLSEDSHTKQALENGKGITWPDDCRIPYRDGESAPTRDYSTQKSYASGQVPASKGEGFTGDPRGRCPANLLVCDDILDAGGDASGGYSRYFSLDHWFAEKIGQLPESVVATCPFLIVPKASRAEKDKGLEILNPEPLNNACQAEGENPTQGEAPQGLNTHPCVKPIKLMAYLVTLGSRPGDLVLDPFAGTATNCIATKMLGRRFIGIEREAEYCRIAEARLAVVSECKAGSDGRENSTTSNIISVSRRTDIPAFYGDWFMKRLGVGAVDYTNPIGGRIHSVSLKPEDVECFVFWSKNFAPFIPKLRAIEDKGYNFYFNFTITGLPNIFECNLVDTDTAIDSLRTISKMYSPRHINWRYDPIVVSATTDFDYHVKRFGKLAAAMEGYTERCYFSFITSYRKVMKSIARFRDETGIEILESTNSMQIDLANQLAEIAHQHGISMFSCCDDFLVNDNIKKAHCIDGEIISELFGRGDRRVPMRPTRKSCGCAHSVDIGAYDTCPHGCIYCYANINNEKAQIAYKFHDPEASVLGKIREDADRKLIDIKESRLVEQNADKASNQSDIHNGRKTFGRREWAEVSVNCCTGCPNNCRYCYARKDALRRHQVKNYDDWKACRIRLHDVRKKRRNYGKRVMFPSTHDITPENLIACLTVLRKLLGAGNEVLIVSKPRLAVIRVLCDELAEFRDSILFRFTITATDNAILAFWEPGAPRYEERRDALTYAHAAGFKTSVSSEPMLDAENIDQLVADLQPLVSDALWIGMMNHIKQIRVDSPVVEQELERIKAGQTDERILAIYNRHRDNPIIKWKGEIKDIVGIPRSEQPGMDE